MKYISSIAGFLFVSGRKKVEVLLQHMFEGEIDPEDEGDEDTLEYLLKQEYRPRKLTLDVVS